MTEKLSFNDIILKLLHFWKEQKCLIWQPYNVQVGAGTMNPATVLRVLGPEPWNIVYVEPSIRPDDGRFGDNPNRMQQHYQLQVILKPDPGNPQELYLQSLEAIGINPREHDIRFVEDNWESPALGAWGLGWEVWLDGQEITQFTYFQQAGGHNLEPVSVEITYGLDRIALALQGVDSVWELNYGAGVVYEHALLQAEIEHCHYYFNGADVEALVAVYQTYEKEAKRCIQAGLVMPAHDYNLKCSHLFNVMDTRGAIGVTERAQYFRRMRQVAQDISALYIQQREELGHPLLQNEQWQQPTQEPELPALQFSQMHTPQTFLLEIGSEELPVSDLNSAIKQLRQAVPELLDKLRLDYRSIEVHGTPRRLVVLVHQLAGRQRDLEVEAKGPPANRAFDADGNPTKAAQGFARSRGIDVSDLRVVTEGKNQYVVATIREEGQLTARILREHVMDLIADIKFEKSMRWNYTNVTYSRPLRWFVALYGPDVVPISYAGILSSHTSRGLRPQGSPPIVIEDAAYYANTIQAQGIVISFTARREQILTDAQKLAEQCGGILQKDDNLLAEVANLVESPTVFLGQFDEKYLQLPAEALVAVMKKHQRYFPVYAQQGGLLPYFIGVRNGNAEHLDLVQHGNEQVILARFADADFFYNNDSKRSLEEFIDDLKNLTFQYELGSMYDKVQRLTQLVPAMADNLNLSASDKQIARRAAALSKADLATSFVVEMTSLQGVLGGHYARKSGESDAVAMAIAEQYEAVSQTPAGLALALSDRLDSLIGLFAVGLAPKGSNDPFALRRAAIQIIENLIANKVDFNLRTALHHAAQLLPVADTQQAQTEVLDFITGRLEVVLREHGLRTTVVRAVLASQSHNPYQASQVAHALEDAIQADDWTQLLDAYARCVRITRKLDTIYTIRPHDFTLSEEQALYQAYEKANAGNDDALSTFITSLRQMEPAITAFFDEVLVMDEDQAIRENRLALLQAIAQLPHAIADLSQLEGF